MTSGVQIVEFGMEAKGESYSIPNKISLKEYKNIKNKKYVKRQNNLTPNNEILYPYKDFKQTSKKDP